MKLSCSLTKSRKNSRFVVITKKQLFLFSDLLLFLLDSNLTLKGTFPQLFWILKALLLILSGFYKQIKSRNSSQKVLMLINNQLCTSMLLKSQSTAWLRCLIGNFLIWIWLYITSENKDKTQETYFFAKSGEWKFFKIVKLNFLFFQSDKVA